MSFAKRRLFLRGDPSFLTDIAVGGRKILAIVEGLEEQSFYRDELRQAAVLHHLTVIGEAVHRLSADLKDDHPEMPWHQIVSVRNRIVHAYFDLEWRILWVTGDVRNSGSACEG